MADLYTSLVRAKQELNGGVLPAMTPVPERLHKIIDPSLTIGMGALTEDPEKGLRCPVRGCGKWFQRLTDHANNQHAGIGGADGIRRALELPMGATLISQRYRAFQKAHARRLLAEGKLTPATKEQRLNGRRRVDQRKAHRRSRASLRGVGMKNLMNSCPAQLRQRLLAVHQQIGRSPTIAEATAIDPSLARAARAVYGTWDNFKAQHGMDRRSRKMSAEQVATAFAAFYEEHGYLPSSEYLKAQTKTPVLPQWATVLGAMGTDSYQHAMEIVASMLNIYGGRYGLPERKNAA